MFSILALSVKSLLFFQSVFLMWGSGFLHIPSPRGYWPLLERKKSFIPIPSPQPDGESLSKGNRGRKKKNHGLKITGKPCMKIPFLRI